MPLPSTANLARSGLAPLRAEAAERAIERDRRAHRRLRGAELSGIEQVRLKFGPAVTLIDLSVGGAQIEAANHRLQPGTPLVIQIVGQGRRIAVPGQVLRCHVSALGKQLTYSCAVEFTCGPAPARLLETDGLHNALDIEVDRPAGVVDDDSPWTLVSAAGLAAAWTMIESASKRRGPECTWQMGTLLKTVMPLFERGTERRVVVESVLDRVGNLISGASIRLLSADQFALAAADDAFYVDVPGASGRTAQRLLIEFPRKGRLETGHLELLRLAAHLVSLANDLEAESAPPRSDRVRVDAP